MREVLLFMCSQMADETNLSSKLQTEQERPEEESSVGDALALSAVHVSARLR